MEPITVGMRNVIGHWFSLEEMLWLCLVNITIIGRPTTTDKNKREEEDLSDTNITDANFSFDINTNMDWLITFVEDKNFAKELLTAIISNSVSMVFIIIGACIAFWLKNYVIRLSCMTKDDAKTLDTQIDKMEAKGEISEVHADIPMPIP